jgi:hypothetical protein
MANFCPAPHRGSICGTDASFSGKLAKPLIVDDASVRVWCRRVSGTGDLAHQNTLGSVFLICSLDGLSVADVFSDLPDLILKL